MKAKLGILGCLLVVGLTVGGGVAMADPPAAVNDLHVETGVSSAAGVFTMPAGATYWEFRYWDSQMTESGWSGYYSGDSGNATQYATVCALIPMDVLDDCHSFYWAVRVYGSGGWSNLSNQQVKSTRCPPNYGEVECP